jgi:hypothetical protein
MTYCIMTVIYGVPLTEEANELICGRGHDEDGEEIEVEEDDESGVGSGDAEACGFEVLYSGSASWMPGFCGVELDSFDECTDGFKLSELKTVPTAEQKKQAEEMVAALDPRVRELCGPIDVYLIPSSS